MAAVVCTVLALAAFPALANGLETAELQSRIDAAAAKGGGTVVVPSGVHRSGALRLKDGVTLRLEKGALLQAGTNDADYVATDGQAFILADGVDHVAVIGEGTIDGGGEAFAPGSLDVPQQPRVLWFRDCRDVRVEGVTIRNGRRWTCFLDRCVGVIVREVTIRSLIHKCCDGIDLECKNAIVENCDIETQDDAICLKARCSDYTVENIDVRNCRLASNCAIIKVGTETLGRVRNVTIRDCSCRVTSTCFPGYGIRGEHWEFALPATPAANGGIVLLMLDGGTLEDVNIRNIDLGASAYVPIFCRFARRNQRIVPGKSAFRRVTIENVRGRALSPIGCSVTGLRDLRPTDVAFRDLDLEMPSEGDYTRGVLPEYEQMGGYVGMFMGIMPAYGFYLRHADRVSFERCRIRRTGTGSRPVVLAEDCTGVQGGCEVLYETSPRKRFIAAGWDVEAAHPAELAANVDKLERLPLDGVVFSLRGTRPDGRDVAPTNVMNGGAWPSDAFADNRSAVRAITACSNMRHCFVGFRASPSRRLDWRDDAAWSAFATNVALLAREAREGGVKGLCPDFEDYHHVWQYVLMDGDPGWDECTALARRRGAEVFGAAFREFPQMTLFLWHFFAHTWTAKFYDQAADVARHVSDRRDLYPSFLNGILDAMPAGARLVDGEESYGNVASSNLFYKSYADRRRLAPIQISPENQAKFKLQTSAAVSVFLDAYLEGNSTSKYYLGPDAKGSHLGHLLEDLGQASRATDEYVWLWGQRYNYAHWKRPEPVPGRKPGWFLGRRTWEDALPGLMRGMRQLSDPNAFARALRARLRAEGASNLVQNSSCETEKGYGFWQDRRFGNGSGGLDASVGERGAAPSVCADGAYGTRVVAINGVKPGERYLVRAASKGQGDATHYLHVGWTKAGAWADSRNNRQIPCVGTDAEGWNDNLGVVTVPEGVDGLRLCLGFKLRKGQRAWFDNVECYRLEDRFEKWVHLRNDITTDEKLTHVLDVLSKAAASGYNAVLWDSAIGGEGFDHDRWDAKRLARLERVKALCRERSLEIVPMIWSIGRAHSVMWNHPELAEGYPVKDVPYVVRGGRAVFEEDDAPVLPAAPKVIDEKSKYIVGRFDVKPFRRYRFSAKIRPQGVTGRRAFRFYFWPVDNNDKFSRDRMPRNLGGVEPGREGWQDFSIDLSTHDRRVARLFCTYDAAKGGKGGCVEWKDVQFRTHGLQRVMSGPGAPFRVRDAKTGEVYVEGRDYRRPDPIPRHLEKIGFHADGPSQEFGIVKGGRIADGARLLVDAYELAEVSPEQYSACMSNPGLYRYFEESVVALKRMFDPKRVFLSLDELRIGGTCAACEARKTDMAHIFAEAVTRQHEILRRAIPGVGIYAWPDMFVPCRNAVRRYEMCADTTYAGAIDLIPKDIVMAVWGGDPHLDEIDFVAKRGFPMLGCGYYDAKDIVSQTRWRDAVMEYRDDFVGCLYTTWSKDGTYGLLKEYADLFDCAAATTSRSGTNDAKEGK